MIPKTTIIKKNYKIMIMSSFFRTYTTTTTNHSHVMMIGSQQQKQYHEPKRRNNSNHNNNIIIRHHYSYPNGPGKFSDTDIIGHKIEHTHDHNHNHHEHTNHEHNNNDNKYNEYQNDTLLRVWKERDFNKRGFTVGIGGPVGSGKTALVLQLCQMLYTTSPESSSLSTIHNIAVVTNDIFTQEDAEFLIRNNALPSSRIRAVETGGCPHAAIREDISANLSALEQLTQLHNNNDSNNNNILLLCESGGDNLAANFSRELADITIYVIDVAGGDKVPRKGGPGITQSDLLIINKIDLANAVGADLHRMEYDANQMRKYNTNDTNEVHYGPTYFCSIKHGVGVHDICQFILKKQQLAYQVNDIMNKIK